MWSEAFDIRSDRQQDCFIIGLSTRLMSTVVRCSEHVALFPTFDKNLGLLLELISSKATVVTDILGRQKASLGLGNRD